MVTLIPCTYLTGLSHARAACRRRSLQVAASPYQSITDCLLCILLLSVTSLRATTGRTASPPKPTWSCGPVVGPAHLAGARGCSFGRGHAGRPRPRLLRAHALRNKARATTQSHCWRRVAGAFNLRGAVFRLRGLSLERLCVPLAIVAHGPARK